MYIDVSSRIESKGALVPNNTNYSAVDNAIRNIVMTERGTVPGEPDFGCNLRRFLFETINPLILTLIEEEIREQLKKYEKRIQIEQIVATEDSDYNRVSIKIDYNIKEFDDVHTTNIVFQ